MSKQAFTEIRDVNVTFDDGVAAQAPMSIDAYKAAMLKVQEIESKYQNNPAYADVTDVVTVFTGTSRYKLYSFNLTTVLADASYQFVYNETVPNADSLS